MSPQGFQVSIPDQPGIKLFAFHGKLNEEMNGREGGTYSRDIIKAKDGRWTFIDKTTRLRPGDVIYYWTYVDYFDGERKLGYVNDDQSYTVTELIPDKTVTTTTARTTTTKAPINNPSCLPTATKVNGKKSCSGKVIFQEKFNNNFMARGIDKWTIECQFAGSPDYEFVLYNNDERNIYVKKNLLHIQPSLTNDRFGTNFVDSGEGLDLGTNCTGTPGTLHCEQKPLGFVILPPVLSARMNTKDAFSFAYGIIEVRAKLPKGDWIYPQIFLNPKKREYGRGYESGQIRIAFLPGNSHKSTKLYGGVILGSSLGGRSYAMKSVDAPTGSWSDDFHDFTVKWEPEKITLMVDHEVYGTITPEEGGFASLEKELGLTGASRWNSGTVFAPFDQEMYISIGVGVGGHTFPDEPTKPWVNNDPKSQKVFYRALSTWYPTWNKDSVLQVDSIQVYAL